MPRGLYWGFTVDFEPLSYEGEKRSCSTTCEWIPWQARTWRDLDGGSLSCNYGDQGVEASFYFVAHDPAETVEVSLAADEDGRFDVTMSMAVDFSGWTGEDANAEMPVSGNVVVPFDGIWLRPDNFDPVPSSEADIKALAEEFLDLRDFSMTEDPTPAIVFRPAFG